MSLLRGTERLAQADPTGAPRARLSLRWRTVGAVFLVVAVGVLAINLLGSFFGYRLARTSDERDVLHGTRAAREALSLQVERLEVTATDWAEWDDSWQFMHDLSPKYVASNLGGDVFRTASLTSILYTDLEDRTVLAKSIDTSTQEPVDTVQPQLVDLARSLPKRASNSEEDRSSAGLLEASRDVLMVARKRILRSDGSGPPAGTLYFAKEVGATEIGAMERVTNTTTRLYGAHAPDLPQDVSEARDELLGGNGAPIVRMLDRDTISAYTLLDGIDGKPAAVLKVSMVPAAYQATSEFLKWTYVALIGYGLLTMLALGLMLNRPLLWRLQRLQQELDAAGSVGDASVRVTADRNDEIGSIASGVNSMLEAIERSDEEQRELSFLASHDPLTQLVNRRRFREEFEREFDESVRLQQKGTVLWIDIDRFKPINDEFGHAVGDEFLIRFADLLRTESRSYSTLSRLGGDEFALILPHADESVAEEVGRRICERLADEEFVFDGQTLEVTCSIGVAEYPADGDNPDEVIEHADLAMYTAKARGGNAISTYSAAGEAALAPTRRAVWANRITKAMRDGRLTLNVMPTVHVADGEPGPYELMLSMRDEDGATIPTPTVISAAEHTGLSKELDRWTLNRAVAMLAEERSKGRTPSFSVNVSASALSDQQLPQTLARSLDVAGVEPAQLVIEVSEAAALADIPRLQNFIREMKAVGCRITLDRFGSGASSFLYLRRLDLDFLKIDGVLVRSLRTARADRYFVRAIVDICRGLDIQTVAEFVEDEDLLAAVREEGVDYAQGTEVGDIQSIESLKRDGTPREDLP
ncbi:MAG: EAL domain-containing protein [Coriobacteriales bacterium]|nr:EAL domain-containing protein [Coriobacteriales bacterium]